MQSKIRRRVVRGCVAVTGLGVAFVALVGYAHTEAGRPLLRYLPGMGGSCPHAELAQMSAVDRDRAREPVEDGTTSVAKAGPEFALLSVNKLDGYTLASPVAVIQESSQFWPVGKSTPGKPRRSTAWAISLK